MENTITVDQAAPMKVHGTNPLVTMAVLLAVITVIVGSGTYVSMMRKGERMPDTGLKKLVELFTPAAAE